MLSPARMIMMIGGSRPVAAQPDQLVTITEVTGGVFDIEVSRTASPSEVITINIDGTDYPQTAQWWWDIDDNQVSQVLANPVISQSATELTRVSRGILIVPSATVNVAIADTWQRDGADVVNYTAGDFPTYTIVPGTDGGTNFGLSVTFTPDVGPPVTIVSTTVLIPNPFVMQDLITSNGFIYDFTDASTLQEADATPPEIGDGIVLADDQTIYNNDAAVGSDPPPTLQQDVDGVTYAQFDGVSQQLTPAQINGAGANRLRFMICVSDVPCLSMLQGTQTGRHWRFSHAGGFALIDIRDEIYTTSHTVVADGKPVVWIISYDGSGTLAGATIYKNGVAETCAGTIAIDTAVGNANLRHIGKNTSVNSAAPDNVHTYHATNLYETVVSGDTALTAQNVADIQAYYEARIPQITA